MDTKQVQSRVQPNHFSSRVQERPWQSNLRSGFLCPVVNSMGCSNLKIQSLALVSLGVNVSSRCKSLALSSVMNTHVLLDKRGNMSPNPGIIGNL